MILAPSQTAQAVAQQLLASAGIAPSADAGGTASGSEAATDTAVRAERVWWTLAAALAAWCGPYAYLALQSRALKRAQALHPALTSLRPSTTEAPQLEGLRDLARNHSSDTICAGVHILLAALIDLLVHVIGESMAVDVVSQALVGTHAAIPDSRPRRLTEDPQ